MCVSKFKDPKCCIFLGPQGVTLTDLQEAEKTMKTTAENRGREKKEEEEKKEAKLKKGEEGVSERRRQLC